MEAPRHWTARACRDPPALRGFALGNPARARARLRRPEPAMLLVGYAASCWASHFGRLWPIIDPIHSEAPYPVAAESKGPLSSA